MPDTRLGNSGINELLSAFAAALAEMAAITDTDGFILAQSSKWNEIYSDTLRAKDEAIAEKPFLEHLGPGLIELSAESQKHLISLYESLIAGNSSAHEGLFECQQQKPQRWLAGKLTALDFSGKRLILLRFERWQSPVFSGHEPLAPQLVYHSLLEDLPILLSICDAEMRYVWINKMFQEQFKVRFDDVVGRRLNQVPGLNGLARIEQLLQACIASGKEQSETVQLSFSGQDTILDTRYIPVLAKDGKVAYVIGADRDITKKVKSQESRAAAHDLLNNVIERMPVGFVATDDHFHILRANNMACSLFGQNREDLVGQHIDLLIPAEYREIRGAGESDVSSQNAEISLMDSSREMFGVRADGSTFPIMASVLRLTLGDFPLYCVMVVDLTQIREAEQKLVENELGIQRMQKQEALGQLAGNIAHDFNNLLAIVLGYADIAQNTEQLPHAIGNMMAEIKKAVQRGAGLTKQILAYAKHQALEVRPMDMHHLLRENQAMIQAALTTGVHLVLNLAAEKNFVAIDENQFMQVMLNLAVNARDAMPLGGSFTITTSTVRLEEQFFSERGILPQAGEYLHLAIVDSGHGMSGEVLSRIFDPYFSTKRRDKGTGLGLSVVYGIIKQHGGFIFCNSTQGVGTRFEIMLPLCDKVAESKSTGPQVTDLATLKEKYAQVTILVVEDEIPIRKMVVALLRHDGFIVHEAENGKKALEFIDGFPGKIDIILSDIMMPEMNGLEMASQAQLMQPNAIFIFISGYSKELLTSRPLMQNMRLLIKPFEHEALLAEIRNALNERSVL